MIPLSQICVFFVAIQWCSVISTPIFETINIERKVNIGFKPFKFRPITFIKEKWGPFGSYMKKHTIQRRDLDEMNTIDMRGEIIKPVSEPIDEPIAPLMTKIDVPIKIDGTPEYRAPVKAVIRDVKEVPPVSKLNTDITGALEPITYFTPVKPNTFEGLGAVPIRATNPIEGPLFVPVSPPPPPPPAPPVEEPPPRFGGLARFFGDILSEIFNRIRARARTTFFPAPPPPMPVQT